MMKKFTVAAVLALSGFIATGSALAQPIHEIRADIPFSFVVGNTVLPAGHYRIDAEQNNEVLIQNDAQPRYAAIAQSYGEPQGSAFPDWKTRGSLTFTQYGGQHFLREVRGPVVAVNAKFLPSKAEQRARYNEGQ